MCKVSHIVMYRVHDHQFLCVCVFDKELGDGATSILLSAAVVPMLSTSFNECVLVICESLLIHFNIFIFQHITDYCIFVDN